MRFLYEACMGLRAPGMFGCILADDMVGVFLHVAWLRAVLTHRLVQQRGGSG